MQVSRRGFLRFAGLAAPASFAHSNAWANSMGLTLKERVERATVQLLTTYSRDDGSSGFIGTGLAFKKRDGYCYICTNEHVIANPKFLSDGYSAKTALYDNNGTIIGLEAVDSNQRIDVAILRTKGDISAIALPDYKELLDGDLEVKYGDKVVTMGYSENYGKIEFGTRNGYFLLIDQQHVPEEKSNDKYGKHVCVRSISPAQIGSSGAPVLKVTQDGLSWIGMFHVSSKASLIKREKLSFNQKSLLEKLALEMPRVRQYDKPVHPNA
ncbi:trypsin-like peptidase domain-containing protein [Candidatus Woesearchaeota archaeon]|nr:trypsin-like peptidase domain-containing protein [Candidatus Woesearchaeota archaeon]